MCEKAQSQILFAETEKKKPQALKLLLPTSSFIRTFFVYMLRW